LLDFLFLTSSLSLLLTLLQDNFDKHFIPLPLFF
jgi:hypothetical protein